MRRLFSLLIAILLVIPGLEAHAAENVYRLDDLGLSVTIPTSLATFTRGTKSNDPNFKAFGITKEQMDSLMEENNIYLNALASNGSYEIVVTMSEIPIDDFYFLSDDELLEFASSLVDGYAEKGVEVIELEVYEHPQAKFVKIHLKLSSDSYGMQYYTIYDGKAISLTMHSYTGKLSVYQKQLIEQAVNSIKFDITPQEGTAKETLPVISTDASVNPFVEKLIVGAISGGFAGAFAALYYSVKKKHAQKVETKKSLSQPASAIAPPSPKATVPSPQIDEETLFCHMCGTKLPKGSAFCYKCGTKIEKG